jgi:hypothetical protein
MKKKFALILIAMFLCMATVGVVTATAASPPKPDTVTSATPNYYRNFSQSYLESLPLTGGYYSCLKSQSPYSFFWQDWYGVKLAYLLDEEVGLADGTTGIRLYAVDNYTLDLSLDRIRNANSQGLFAILAWQAGNSGAAHQEPPLPPLTSGGPFRLAIGQYPNVGDYASGGTPNYNLFLKSVRAVEVQPLPPGVTPVDPTTIPADKIVVYGNIHPFSIDHITPSTGPNGTEVTVSGYGFYAAQGTGYVSFGATEATEYTEWSPKEIKCKVPAGVTGTVDVTVTNSEGTTNAVPFTVAVLPPTIASIAPDYGVQNTVVSVTNLAGTGFQSGASVRIEQGATVINATDVNVVSDTQITCTLNLNGAPLGKYDVFVKNPDNQEAKLTQGFRVTNICGGGAAVSLSVFGVMMGLLSIAGAGGIRRRLKKK